MWVPAVGDAHLVFPGDGTWIGKGRSPRVTIIKQSGWGEGAGNGVESTVYCKPLVTPDDIDIRAKTDHYCVPDGDFGGYTVIFKWAEDDNGKITGRTTFKKEQTHALGYSSRMGTKRYPQIPQDRLIGFKSVVYNLPNGHVKLEAYIDRIGDGKNFEKIAEETDDNTKRWEIGADKKVYSPYTKATKGSALRCNSLDVADGGTDYAEYLFTKWTIREIKIS